METERRDLTTEETTQEHLLKEGDTRTEMTENQEDMMEQNHNMEEMTKSLVKIVIPGTRDTMTVEMTSKVSELINLDTKTAR